MIETNLKGNTPDIADENIQKLRQIFPDVFTEDKVDFEKLQQVLGDYAEDSNERYNFTWNGKGRALRLSQTPSLGTLRPCKEESKDWDTTQNLYIEGDNLEVLKLLQKSYYGKVKMIYIDPPYNTGKDFVYPDDFHDSLENYKKITGQVDSEGNRISTNTEASGRYHTDWLNMMYPRLRLARNLLTDDGIIFISIDDNEAENLKKICNEVFGEDNFIAQFVWTQSKLDEELMNGTIANLSSKFGFNVLRSDQSEKIKRPSTLIDNKVNVGTNEDAYNETIELFGQEGIMSYPKPLSLIKFLVNTITYFDKDSIILDFFSGSSTTAHAVMQLNAEDGGNRKFIMVQLPELTDEKSEAYKAGYMNICEIGKERIRRAGEKIKEENKDKGNIANLDIGFKVLKLDTSNIRKWQPNYDNLEQSIFDYLDNYVEGRTELDVVYEIMLKYGLDLTYPVNEFTVAQKKVYSIGVGMLMICLDNEITTEVAKGILEKVKELAPESTRVVFKDNGFKTDSNKTNIKEILKCGGIEEFITL